MLTQSLIRASLVHLNVGDKQNDGSLTVPLCAAAAAAVVVVVTSRKLSDTPWKITV